MSTTIGDAIMTGTRKVTAQWTRYQKARIRSSRAQWRPRYVAQTIKDVAAGIMPEAYTKAAGRTGMAFPRQVFYAARPLILAALDDDDKKLSSVYFTQVLLPDFCASHPRETAGWDLLWDDRGHFQEPHTDYAFGLGTLNVRAYLQRCRESADLDVAIDPLSSAYPTRGPAHRFKHVILIEKEGFAQIFEHAKIQERFDVAVMSSKGMSTTAARQLVEQLPGVKFLVLHDLDKSGFSILGTLTRSTRRYHFRRQADVIDLGIRLADVTAEHLEAEPVSYTHDPEANLRLNGATEEEIEFLVGGEQRVELNAFDSDSLIDWLERKLVAVGVTKLIPSDEILTAAYRRAVMVCEINAAIAAARKPARDVADAAPIPADLRAQIQQQLDEDPSQSWDDALAALVE